LVTIIKFITNFKKNDEEWSNWSSLEGITVRGGPHIAKTVDSRLAIFARGSDRAIWIRTQTTPSSSTWTAWQSLGGTFASSPFAILSSEGYLYVFAVAEDRSLLYKYQFEDTSSNEVNWSTWQSLGGSLTSLPSVVLDTEGLIHIFARGLDRGLWHKGQIADNQPRSVRWDEWESLGGALTSGPHVPAIFNSIGLLEIIVRATDQAYWQIFQVPNQDGICSICSKTGVSWSKWQSLGGIFTSGPASTLSSDGTVELFGRGPDNGLWYKGQHYDGSNLSWKKWTSIGGILSTNPEVATRADGLLTIFARGVDKNIWLKTQQVTSNGTVEFGNWSLLGGTTKSFPC